MVPSGVWRAIIAVWGVEWVTWMNSAVMVLETLMLLLGCTVLSGFLSFIPLSWRMALRTSIVKGVAAIGTFREEAR